jgi:hypothetical protein
MATLKRSPRLSHDAIKEHAEEIKKEIQNESFMNEETNTIYFKKYYRTVLQHAYDSVVMTPYNKREKLSQNNNIPSPLTPEEMQDQIKSNFVRIFKYSTDLLIPIIEGYRLEFKMIDGTSIVGEYYEYRMNFPVIIPYHNNTLPVRITGLEFGIDVEKKLKGYNRIFDPYTGRYKNTKYEKRTIPMHEIDTIQIVAQEAGKRRTRKRTKRTKQTRRRR